MGRKDWERMASDDNFVAVKSAEPKSRVPTILGGVLLLGGIGFLVSYYVPLFRAHEKLNDEYVRVAKNAVDLQDKLNESVAALKHSKEEASELREARAEAALAEKAAQEGLALAEKSLKSKLATALGQKLVRVERDGHSIVVRFERDSLQKSDSVAPTKAGSDLLCQAVRAGGKPKAISMIGTASETDLKHRSLRSHPSAWHLAAARGASGAEAITRSCSPEGATVFASGSVKTAKNSEVFSLRLDY